MKVYAGFYGTEVALTNPPVAIAAGIDLMIYDADGTTLSSLYTDHLRSAAAANPLTTSSEGEFTFYAEPGVHVIRDDVGAPATVFVAEWADEPLITASGATGARPSAAALGLGAQWFDTTLGKPIWSDGANWRDAAGVIV